MSNLAIPRPGGLNLSRSFIDRELVEETNGSFNPLNETSIYTNNLLFGDAHISVVEERLKDSEPDGLVKMTKHVIKSVPNLEWNFLTVYVRVLGVASLRSLGIHVDTVRDTRVLVEGGRATWEFDQPKMLRRYPYGIKLSVGDAITINNRCDPASQLRHGVRMDDSDPYRISYLFNFSYK